MIQKHHNYLIQKVQNNIVINLDVEEPGSGESDISQEQPQLTLPKLDKIQKSNLFRPIEPVYRPQIHIKPRQYPKKQAHIEIQDSEGMQQEQHALEINSQSKPLGDYRPLKRRLIKAANKCKIERKQFSSTDCSICLYSLQNKMLTQIGKLKCNHAFCFDCIYESSRFANKCPYCRTTYREIEKGDQIIPIQEKELDQQQDFYQEPCYVCGRNDDFDHLLECQYCEAAFCHTYCDTRLGSSVPPEGSWYCLSCSEIIQLEEVEDI